MASPKSEQIRRGTVAELIAAAHFTSAGNVVSIPMDHANPYDLIIDSPTEGLKKIQVKRAFWNKEYNSSYRVDIGGGYGDDRFFDYLVCVVLEENKIYIIPWESMKHVGSKLGLYINGKYPIPHQVKNNFEQYMYELSTD